MTRGLLITKMTKPINRGIAITKVLFSVGFISLLFNGKSVKRFLQLDRLLIQNLGEGNCKWSKAIDETNIENPVDVEATLIAGFPGVGKRLVWAIVEQFTNRKIGDDWNVAEVGENLVALKTSFPHPEGNWTWDDRMHQVLLVVRNPMQALIAYHNIKDELKPATNLSEVKRLNKEDEIYTKRASFNDWYKWRDAAFDTELDLYGWFIEFWMDNGRRRNDGEGEAYYDVRCSEKMAHTCVPKAVIEYEALMDPLRGEDETTKIAAMLIDSVGVPVIDQSVWACAYREIMKKNTLYTDLSRTSGPVDAEKKYSYQQLGAMRREIERLRDKYDHPVYVNVPAAAQIVVSMNNYLIDINAAYAEAWNLHQETM